MFLIYTFFFLIMYIAGWTLMAIPQEYISLYIIGLYLAVNFFTILNTKMFSIAVMRPLQLSYASILIYSFLDNKHLYELFAVLLLASFIVMEWEDFKYTKAKKKIYTMINQFKMTFMFALLPFSVTYSVMIFRPDESIFIPVVLIGYFTVLYFSGKYLYAKRLVWIFVITQILGFGYLTERYYGVGLYEIMIFACAVASFLLINQGRKGLLGYFEK